VVGLVVCVKVGVAVGTAVGHGDGACVLIVGV
jgi:hypothetical protein